MFYTMDFAAVDYEAFWQFSNILDFKTLISCAQDITMLISGEGRKNKVHLRKSMVTIVLIMILIFSISSTGAFVAQAGKTDPTIGKFLEIDFAGSDDGVATSNCYVTATKDSGQVFTFEVFENLTYSEKVGAGTVLLEAIPDNGWEFQRWISDDVETTPFGNNFAYYKTEKLGVVGAVFTRDTYTVTAVVAGAASNGTILIDNDSTGVIDVEEITGGYIVTVNSGANITFELKEFVGNHVSAIQADGAFEPYAQSYTFANVQSSHSLTVYFSTDGQAYIPAGSNVVVYLGDNVSLNFTSTSGGTAVQENILGQLDPIVQSSSLILWNIGLVVEFPFGAVTITLPYTLDATHPEITSIFTSENVDALYSDINGDGEVNGDDVSDVANMIKTLVGQQIYDPLYDIDRNTILDQNDVHMVNDNKGAIIEELEFDPIYDSNGSLIGYLIYTGHFSIFRGR
jgi:hypothetical protein